MNKTTLSDLPGTSKRCNVFEYCAEVEEHGTCYVFSIILILMFHFVITKWKMQVTLHDRYRFPWIRNFEFYRMKFFFLILH